MQAVRRPLLTVYRPQTVGYILIKAMSKIDQAGAACEEFTVPGQSQFLNSIAVTNLDWRYISRLTKGVIFKVAEVKHSYCKVSDGT
jgi:hypothetical protein